MTDIVFPENASAAMRVYLVMQAAAVDGVCTISLDQLGQNLGRAHTSARAAVEQLLECGAVVRLSGGRPNETARYRVAEKYNPPLHQLIFDWTPAALDTLRALWDEGLSAAAIGRRLGTTKNSVVGKCRRLNLPARPSPIIREATTGTTRRAKSIQPTRPTATLPPLTSSVEQIPRAMPVIATILPGRLTDGLTVWPAASVQRGIERGAEAAAQMRREAIRTAAQPRQPPPEPDPIKPYQRVVECCWPIGEPGHRDFRFCAEPSMGNKSYCPVHAAKAYVPICRDDDPVEWAPTSGASANAIHRLRFGHAAT